MTDYAGKGPFGMTDAEIKAIAAKVREREARENHRARCCANTGVCGNPVCPICGYVTARTPSEQAA